MDGAGPHASAHPERELQALLVRLAQGDRSAFQPLFHSLWPLLRRFSTHLLGSAADGDDAAQQALLKVYSRSREYDPVRPALPWLLAIATNECRTLRKRRLRRGEVSDSAAGQVVEGRPSPEETLIVRDLEVALAEVFATLRLADVHTLASVLAADRATRPPIAAATFRKRVERALERLRLAWRAKHGAL